MREKGRGGREGGVRRRRGIRRKEEKGEVGEKRGRKGGVRR